MNIKIKKLCPEATIPQYAHDTDAGLDLTAISVHYKDGVTTYGTGLAVEIPEGYVGLLFPRSSNYKQDLLLSNSVGVIDSGYRGEIKLAFKNVVTHMTEEDFHSWVPKIWQLGDRVGQLIILPYPKINFVDVGDEDLSTSDRNIGGFGSTGK